MAGLVMGHTSDLQVECLSLLGISFPHSFRLQRSQGPARYLTVHSNIADLSIQAIHVSLSYSIQHP